MSYLTVDEKMKALISAIENSKEFDLSALGDSSGLGVEALLLYRNYIAGKSLVAQASINYFRLGLQSTLILIRAEHPLMGPLGKALEMLLSTPGFYMHSLGTPLGQNLFITRHIIPKGIYNRYLAIFDELMSRGIINGYEVSRTPSPVETYSLDPSVFNYATGNWKIGTYTFKVKREIRSTSTDPVPFDEVDLKIVSMLRKAATTTPEAMANATGLSVGEVAFHLKEHVLGGGDPNKSMVSKYHVHFMEPGLFAPDTMMLNVFARADDQDELVSGLISIPYLFFCAKGEVIHALLYGPLQGLYAIWHEIEAIGEKLKAKELMGYISPWYDFNVLGSLRSPVSLDRDFKNGKWVFEPDEIVDFVVNSVRGSGVGRRAHACRAPFDVM
ncbi:AsnC family protein [Tardisphaera miroshnichenkoae]